MANDPPTQSEYDLLMGRLVRAQEEKHASDVLLKAERCAADARLQAERRASDKRFQTETELLKKRVSELEKDNTLLTDVTDGQEQLLRRVDNAFDQL